MNRFSQAAQRGRLVSFVFNTKGRDPLVKTIRNNDPKFNTRKAKMDIWLQLFAFFATVLAAFLGGGIAGYNFCKHHMSEADEKRLQEIAKQMRKVSLVLGTAAQRIGHSKEALWVVAIAKIANAAADNISQLHKLPGTSLRIVTEEFSQREDLRDLLEDLPKIPIDEEKS